MSKRNKFWGVLTLLVTLFILGCSKDDEGTQTINDNGGNVYRYQVVTVDIPDTNLNQDVYDATFGNTPVTLIRAEEHQLVFGVPAEAELGNAELIIPGLNNAKVNYNVLQQQLNKSADETMADLFTLGSTYFAGIQTPGAEDNDALNAFEQFETYYTGLSDDEKQTVALYYQINKQSIDDVILFNGENIAGRFSAGDVLIITKFSLAVAATAGGGIAVLYGDVSLKLLGAVIAKIGYSKAIVYHNQLQERSIKVVYLSASGILGENLRGAQNSEITLINDVASTIPFKLVERPLTQNDSNNANTNISKFFSKQSLYNNFAGKVNTAIQWVNDNTWLTLSAIPTASLPSNPPQTQADVTATIMQDITFSINHPNLELVSTAVQNDGQLNIKVKFTGNPTQTTIESTLNFTYNDGLSAFEGTFPIKVNGEEQLISTIQFTLSGSGLVFPDTSNSIYTLFTSITNEADCSNNFLRFEDQTENESFIFNSDKLVDLMNSPIGTQYAFGNSQSNCNDGNYIHFNVGAPTGTYTTEGFDFGPYGFYTQIGSGSFTKTGSNSFSFFGTVESNVGNTSGGTYTAQISGTGTLYLP